MCRICADIEKSMRKIGFLPPEIGSHNIVQGKTYDTAEPNGLFLYEQIEDKLRLQTFKQSVVNEDLPLNRYGKEYYAYHGHKLVILPERKDQLPDPYYLEWHNENVYLG